MERSNTEFCDLSLRHKRRRLAIDNNRRHQNVNAAQIPDDSESSSDESLILENEAFQINSPDLEDYLDDSAEEQSSDNEASESSHEEDSEEENEEEDDEADRGQNIEDHDQIPEENVDSESSEEENVRVPQDLREIQKRTLKNVFLSANIKHNQGNLLLKALRAFPFNLVSLPQDTRTLLNTPTSVATRFVQQVAGGEYLHIGFEATITQKLQNVPEDILPNQIEIDFSTDGAQLNKGTDQFWPHQYRILNIPDKRPIIAGVYKGKRKPNNPFEFFEPFIGEIVRLRDQGGITIGNRRLPLIIRCFIADAPARAFALNHYGHTSANACSKCKVEGHRCTTPGFEGTMVFPGIRHPLRTDEEYRNLIDEDHHKGRSPLAALIGLVTRVPFEIMHLGWLGNGKKVVAAQVGGKFGFERVSVRKRDILDARMVLLKDYCPSEFNRRPNEMKNFHSFKASEFRQLLLYTAPAVFKDVLVDEYYNHLMILHCVFRLLSSEALPQEMYAFCQEALESYVTLCEQLYGQQFLSYNVHGLLHVVADVQELGGLDTYSAFCYENHMPEFRKRIRKPHLPLQQFYKRLVERNNFDRAPEEINIQICVSQAHADGPLPNDMPPQCRQFHKLTIGKTTLSTKLRDSCCILKDSIICIIRNIVQVDGTTFLVVQKFRTASEIYDVGVSSDFVGVYHCTNLYNRVQAVNLNDVANKCYRMPRWSRVVGEEENAVENEWICVSLLSPLIMPQH